MTADEAREVYKEIRSYVVGADGFRGAAKDFDQKVKDLMDKAGITDPTPEQWVEYAQKVTWTCGRCAGTGIFVTYVENGVPKGPGGTCFRCEGKGFQRAKDARRNYWHDYHYAGRVAV